MENAKDKWVGSTVMGLICWAIASVIALLGFKTPEGSLIEAVCVVGAIGFLFLSLIYLAMTIYYYVIKEEEEEKEKNSCHE